MIHLVSIARRVCFRFFLVFDTLDLGLCVARYVTCSLGPFVMMHVVHVVSIALHAFESLRVGLSLDLGFPHKRCVIRIVVIVCARGVYCPYWVFVRHVMCCLVLRSLLYTIGVVPYWDLC